MNKYLLRGAIAIDLIIFYFLLILAIFYFLLGWEPVLCMAGVLTALVLVRLIGLHLTRPERALTRSTHQQLSDRATTLLGLSFAAIIALTVLAGVYLYMRFGWLTAISYTIFSLITASIFETSYETLETSTLTTESGNHEYVVSDL